jgi:hypothetical protein
MVCHVPLSARSLLVFVFLASVVGAQNVTAAPPPPTASKPPSFDVELVAAWVFLDLAVIM